MLIDKIEDKKRRLEIFDVVRREISPSLFPFLFDFLGSGRELTASRFDPDHLAQDATLICKLAGILVQAQWYALRCQRRDEEIPPAVDHLLLQFWAGHQPYSAGLAISLLHEVSLAPPSSTFHQMVHSPKVFVEWRRLLTTKTRRVKQFLNDLGKVDVHHCFLSLIEALPLLRVVSYRDGWFTIPTGSVPEFPFVYWSPSRTRPLFLHGFEDVDSKPSVIFEDPYSDYIEEVDLSGGGDNIEPYRLMRQVLGLPHVKPGILYLFGPGYDNIQNLAKVIAASPASVIKRLRDIFGESGIESTDAQPAEDFVTLLLARCGPAEVLTTIFKEFRENQFEHYLQVLDDRGEANKVTWMRRYEEEWERKEKSLRGYLDLDSVLRKEVADRMNVETRCWAVLSAAGFQLDERSLDYVETIGMRLQMVKRFLANYHTREWNIDTTGINVGKLIERTLRFLVCFYAGLIGYHKSSEGSSDRDENERRMVAAASACYEEVSYATAGTLIARFRDQVIASSKMEYVYGLLRRPHICDIKKLKALMPDTWISVLNRIKHDPLKKNPLPPVTSDEVVQFATTTLSLFRFLICGREVTEPDAINFVDKEPVYPQVVSFREARRQRDGLVIYNYELDQVEGAKRGAGIKILTPREYSPNQQYYCIPVKGRSTREWLVDPLLIRCHVFDKIFRETTD